MEEIRQDLIRLFADPKITVKYVDNAGQVFDRAPETKAFAPILPPAEVMQPLERVTDAMWPSAPVIPEMETGASDSVYTIAAGHPDLWSFRHRAGRRRCAGTWQGRARARGLVLRRPGILLPVSESSDRQDSAVADISSRAEKPCRARSSYVPLRNRERVYRRDFASGASPDSMNPGPTPE